MVLERGRRLGAQDDNGLNGKLPIRWWNSDANERALAFLGWAKITLDQE